MNAITRHKQVLEEIQGCTEKINSLRSELNTVTRKREELLKEEKDLFHQIQKESLFQSVEKDDTI